MDKETHQEGPKIEHGMVIEDALQVLIQADSKTATVVNNTKPVGSIDVDKMVAALARPDVITSRTDQLD